MLRLWRAGILLFSLYLSGQTTDGLITGRVTDSQTGASVAGAVVICSNPARHTTVSAHADAAGYFVLPLLPPGVYRVRITAETYQAQEVQELTLTVAGAIELKPRLRPLSDVWEAGQLRSVFLPGRKVIVNFFG